MAVKKPCRRKWGNDMGKHSMQLRSTLLLFALVTHAYCAQSTPLAVDGVALHVVERDGSQSDKLLIQTRNQSLALDLNRSVGIRGSAHITPEGILIAGVLLATHEARPSRPVVQVAIPWILQSA